MIKGCQCDGCQGFLLEFQVHEIERDVSRFSACHADKKKRGHNLWKRQVNDGNFSDREYEKDPKYPHVFRVFFVSVFHLDSPFGDHTR